MSMSKGVNLDLMKAGLQAGGKVRIDLASGRATLTFSRADYSRADWETLVKELLLRPAPRRREAKP